MCLEPECHGLTWSFDLSVLRFGALCTYNTCWFQVWLELEHRARDPEIPSAQSHRGQVFDTGQFCVCPANQVGFIRSASCWKKAGSNDVSKLGSMCFCNLQDELLVFHFPLSHF